MNKMLNAILIIALWRSLAWAVVGDDNSTNPSRLARSSNRAARCGPWRLAHWPPWKANLKRSLASLFGPIPVSYGAFAPSVHVTAPGGPEQVQGHSFSVGTDPVSTVVRNLSMPVGPPT